MCIVIGNQAFSSKSVNEEPLLGPNIGGASAPKPYGFRRLWTVQNVKAIMYVLCVQF